MLHDNGMVLCFLRIHLHIAAVLFRNCLLLICYIPRVEAKERECWKFLDWRLNSENESRVHGQPSIGLSFYSLVIRA